MVDGVVKGQYETFAEANEAAKNTNGELHIIKDYTEETLNVMPASYGYKLVVDKDVIF